MFTTDPTSVFYGLLLGIVSFFLHQFYKLVKKMAEDIKNILISNAKSEERIRNLEEEVKDIRSDIKSIKTDLR